MIDRLFPAAMDLSTVISKSRLAKRRRKARCGLFCADTDVNTVAGYDTLSQHSVDLVKLPEGMAKKLPKYREVPATLLGRLAVSERFRGQKLGEFLMLDALYRCLRQSQQVRSAAVVVDVKDEPAKSFYEHFEFVALPDSPNRLFFP